MANFIKFWVIGWLVMAAWYLMVALMGYRSQPPERRGKFILHNLMGALISVVWWPGAMLIIIAWAIFNGRGRSR
jgi:hypothetical protein